MMKGRHASLFHDAETKNETPKKRTIIFLSPKTNKKIKKIKPSREMQKNYMAVAMLKQL